MHPHDSDPAQLFTDDLRGPSVARLGRFVAASGMAIATGGLISLSGWFVGSERLTDWLGTGITMKANTALTAALMGVGLFLLGVGRATAAALCGAFVVLPAIATLAEHVTGVDLGIDQILAVESPGARATSAPGRMGPPASTAFLLLGLSLIACGRAGRMRRFVPALSLTVIAVSLLSLVGYIYNAELMFSAPKITGISVQTAAFAFLAGVALLASVPDRYPARLLFEPSGAGTLARRALPIIVLLPVVIGKLRLEGQEASWYDGAFGTALRTLVEVVLSAGLLWWAVMAVRNREAALLRSERRLSSAKESLAVKERQLQHIADNAAVMVAQCDTALRYIYVNRTCADFLGKPASEIVGLPIASVMGEPAFQTIRPFIERVLHGERVEFEIEVPYSRRGPRWMHVVYVPDGDDPRRPSGWIASITDVTDRRRAEEALREANQRKDEFLAMLAHELRNPLAPILTGLELLSLDQEPTSESAKLLTVMRRQMDHMVRLIDDLLDVSRISRGKLQLKKDHVDVAGAINRAVEGVQPLARAGDIRLRINLPSEPLYLEADPARLTQIVGNLLNNACRYTQPGGSVELEASRRDGEVVVAVRDSGIGIPPNKLEEIFQMFTQVERSEQRGAGGLGIGLHLVRELAQLHGGTATAFSAGLGRGSEFVVRLPNVTSSLKPQGKPPGERPTNVTPLRVFVVDDNVDAANSMAALLSAIGHEVGTAHDGLDAPDKAAAFAPQVVLLDLGLPNRNGYDVCRDLRERPATRESMIIALTGWGRDEDRRKSIDAGFDAHLVKPVELKELMTLLRSRKAPDSAATAGS